VNVEKAELKILVATDIGASIEDSFEAAKKEMCRQEGAVGAFVQAAKACEQLCEHVDKDVEEGKIESLEVAVVVKRWITRTADIQRNLQRRAENLGMAAAGKVSALEQTVALVSKYRQIEEVKLQAARLISPDDPSAAEVTRRPGLSIKERRLAEQEAERAEAEKLLVPPAPPAPPAKRRGRPAKKR